MGEFVVGDGFVAAGAESSDSEAGHEDAAVGAALLAELAGVEIGRASCRERVSLVV